LTTFPTRKAWAKHEIDNHLSSHKYQCPVCFDTIDTEDDFIQHLQSSHSTKTQHLRSTILSKAQFAVFKPLDTVDCRLCQRRGFANHREYSTHVGRHLEEIALVPLPPIADSDDEDEDDTDSEGSANLRLPAPNKHTSLISVHSNKDITVSVSPASRDDEKIFIVDVFVNPDGQLEWLGSALLDSGTTRSFISESIAVRATDLKLTTIESTGFEQLDGIENNAPVLGKIRLKFTIRDIPYRHTFLVIPDDDRFDILLGKKFLVRSRILYDEKNRLEWWTETQHHI
jgi:hypothetical protein